MGVEFGVSLQKIVYEIPRIIFFLVLKSANKEKGHFLLLFFTSLKHGISITSDYEYIELVRRRVLNFRLFKCGCTPCHVVNNFRSSRNSSLTAVLREAGGRGPNCKSVAQTN
jgi:hypothetical protein